MSVVEEGAFGEEGGEEGSPEPKSKTALSILESLASAGQAAAAPAEGSGVDAESVESADSVGGSPIEDDVFELEGLDGLDGVRKWKLKSSRGRTLSGRPCFVACTFGACKTRYCIAPENTCPNLQSLKPCA